MPGYWLNNETFNYTGFKLSVAVGCEYQLIQERSFRESIELAKKLVESDYSKFKITTKTEQERLNTLVNERDKKLDTQQAKFLKRELGIVGVGLVAIISAWIIAKK